MFVGGSKGEFFMTTVHIRRCHVCGNTNESENAANLKCQSCGKPMAPFYYFDESQLDGLLEMGPYLSILKEAPDYNPLYGLSIYWDDTSVITGASLRKGTA